MIVNRFSSKISQLSERSRRFLETSEGGVSIKHEIPPFLQALHNGENIIIAGMEKYPTKPDS